jgi:hypothetical protein
VLLQGDEGITPVDLDECGGHTDSTYAYYHYHVTDGYTSPYTVCQLSQLLRVLLPAPAAGRPAVCTTPSTQLARQPPET